MADRVAGPWRERWIAWRNRRLSDPVFQRWAADFPLTRGVARRRAADLFDVVAGFVYSQTLEAFVRLRLPGLLMEGAADTSALAARLAVPEEALRRLLGAAATLGLTERTGPDRWALGSQGAALIGSAGLAEMIAHHRHLYADLADPVALLHREQADGALAAYWPYAAARPGQTAGAEAVAAYSALMAATQPAVAADILSAYPLVSARRLLDIGGGEGVFLAAAGARAPTLALELFDLPAVIPRAQARLAEAGLLSRARLHPGDFRQDALPPGADLITLVRILHDHDDATVALLLAKARTALAPGGALLIAEPMSAAPRPDRVADAYFAFYLLAMGKGRARTPAEIASMLRTAGFRRIRRRRTRTPSLLRVLVAQA